MSVSWTYRPSGSALFRGRHSGIVTTVEKKRKLIFNPGAHDAPQGAAKAPLTIPFGKTAADREVKGGEMEVAAGEAVESVVGPV